jgi:hypothetical protein
MGEGVQGGGREVGWARAKGVHTLKEQSCMVSRAPRGGQSRIRPKFLKKQALIFPFVKMPKKTRNLLR